MRQILSLYHNHTGSNFAEKFIESQILQDIESTRSANKWFVRYFPIILIVIIVGIIIMDKRY